MYEGTISWAEVEEEVDVLCGLDLAGGAVLGLRSPV